MVSLMLMEIHSLTGKWHDVQDERVSLAKPVGFAQIASIPVGYNNPRLIKAAQSPEMVRALVNRPALGNFPSIEWLSTLQDGILKAAGYCFRDTALRPNKPDPTDNSTRGWGIRQRRSILMRAIVREIQERELIAKTMRTGNHLFNG